MEWNYGIKSIYLSGEKEKLEVKWFLSVPKKQENDGFHAELACCSVVRIDEYKLPLDKTQFPSQDLVRTKCLSSWISRIE